jgi:hypothetical protein
LLYSLNVLNIKLKRQEVSIVPNNELEFLKFNCKKLEMDIAHLRNVIAKMRSYDTVEFSKEIDLIRKLRERIEILEQKVENIEKRLG